MTKIQAIDIKLIKNGVDLIIDLKVAPEIEAYFKGKSKGYAEQSGKWLDKNGNGLYFYGKNETMSRKVGNEQVMDNFGNGLIDGSERINVALLRIVGASAGVSFKTNDLLTYTESKEYIEKLARWTRKFYENHLRPSEISALIGFEVED